MKLQKQLSRKYEGKEYTKWVVVIPPSKVEELNWEDGEELNAEVQENKLILKRARKTVSIHTT